MSVRIGSQKQRLEREVPEEEEYTNININTTKYRLILVTKSEFELIANRLGMPELLREPEKHSGKAWMNYLRKAGIPLGKFLTLVVSQPEFMGKGVTVAFIPEAE